MASVRCLSLKLAPALCLALGALSASSQATERPAPQNPSGSTAAAPSSDPKYLAAMAEAKQLVHDRQYVFAMDKYRKANKIAGGKDRDSLSRLLELQFRFGEYKDAINTASILESAAVTPAEKSRGESDLGRAIFLETGSKNKVDKLQAADAAFKAAIADNPKNATAHYFDGQVLARLQQMDAASEQFKQCLACISPNDPSYTRAQHFAENPQLSTSKMAPPFVVTALDGTKFNLDEMGGRVVLIDFWATCADPATKSCPTSRRSRRSSPVSPSSSSASVGTTTRPSGRTSSTRMR